MAEYIDKMEVLNKLQGRKTIELVRDIKPADVIERSEYEYLKKENRELAIKYDNAMNRVADGLEEISRLRSKIDKAIAEIDDLSCTIGDYSYSGGLEMALEILKRNIGE